MKPVIGICADVKSSRDDRCDYELSLKGNYSDAIIDAGGVPIIIPPGADPEVVVRFIHGILIPGGNDLDPALFGQAQHPMAELQDSRRYAAESALYRIAPTEMPLLGICGGCQVINVIQGGSLIQHLPDTQSSAVHTGGIRQTYRIEPGSKAARAFGSTKVGGKSYHHQAIERPGENVKVVGTSEEDDVVEAIEVEGRRWTIGVQWHPERTLDDDAMRSLFSAFVMEAGAYATRAPLPVH